MIGSTQARFLVLLLAAGLISGCSSLPPTSPASLPPGPASAFLPLRIATWNVERFDGAGPGDNTPPTRTDRHLKMIAQILIATRADIIGLQEIDWSSEFSDISPFEQILQALNEEEALAKGRRLPGPVWKGRIGEIEGLPQRVALIWNEEVVEALAIRELEELRVGYTGIRGLLELEDLRFPRIPLAGRFRLRGAPEFDLTVIVLHLKARGAGFEHILDTDDIRRRGELEDLLTKWILPLAAPGEWDDREIIMMGDLNETSRDLVRLLDEFGTRPEVKGILHLDPGSLPGDKMGFLITDAALSSPRDYTYLGNSEKGSVDYRGRIQEEDKVWESSKALIDHILISAPLVSKWDGSCEIFYFEERYPLSDHVHFSDHRPVVITLYVPVGSVQGR